MNFPNINNQKIIIGLSGGKDSSALLHMAINFYNIHNIIPVIINHNLREESYMEAYEIQKYWKNNFNINIYIIHWYNPIGKQVKAREFRLLQLALFAIKNNTNIVFLAHNLEDKIETYIIRKDKNSTTWGLASISYETIIYSIRFIRPLLFTSIKYILNYIKEYNIKIFEDYTNKTCKYTRNLIRNKLIKHINVNEIHNNIIEFVTERIKYTNDIQEWIRLHLQIINKFTYRFIWNRLPINKKFQALILMYITESLQGKRIDSYEKFYLYINKYENFNINKCHFIFRGLYVYVKEILNEIIFLKQEGLWNNKFIIVDMLNKNREFIFMNTNKEGIFSMNNTLIDFNIYDEVYCDNFYIKYTGYNFYNKYII